MHTEDGYYVYARGPDRKGQMYRSADGLNYYFQFDHSNHTVPQVLNQGLDGSLYLMTNTGPGWLRNPFLAFAFRGRSFVDPIAIHAEKQIGDDQGPEVPFCDHGTGANGLLGGRWRHLICYRVLDLREPMGKVLLPGRKPASIWRSWNFERRTTLRSAFDLRKLPGCER